MFKNKAKLIILVALVLALAMVSVACGQAKDTTNGKNEPVVEGKNNEPETNNKPVEKTNDDTIIVGVSGEFYPLNFMKDDVLQGYEVDVWNEIAARTGYNVEYKAAKFAGLFGMLNAEQVDTISHSIAINSEREETYSFTESYLNANYQLVTKKDSGLNELEDFRDKKIGVVAGGLGDKMLQKVNEENNLNIDIQGYEGTAAMDMDVDMGRLDARLGPAIQTRATIKEQDLNFVVTDVVIFTETAAFPFRKDERSEGIIKDVNEAIKAMKEDGTLSELSIKWFEVDATK